MISISEYLNENLDEFVFELKVRHSKNEHYEDDECLDNYSEDDKTAINAICKTINQNHKDI